MPMIDNILVLKKNFFFLTTNNSAVFSGKKNLYIKNKQFTVISDSNL